ncbi:hypothetical protein E5676_scaffold5G00230 [Cucumis melo var. makuwa]|uniref:Uncharacterized protein n=1 Tax=Cucumis melo var. makuwa TaxID=1194695 RepID=A0A5D3CQX6_CUCMM|nr:hypothetical protein E5676_scaffold5G00230 [Cucumis melo var. makuwa]
MSNEGKDQQVHPSISTSPSPPPIKTYKAVAQSQPNKPSKNEVKIASHGGWIDVFDLPPLWNEQIVQFIGNHCGGFIGSSNQTDRGLNQQAARLKVNTHIHGLIPACLIIPKVIAGSEITENTHGVNVPTTTNRLGTMVAKI